MRETLALLARPNYRGRTTDELVYMIQDVRTKIAELDPAKIQFQKPSTHTVESWVDDHLFFLEETVKGLEEEIQRRRDLKYSGTLNTPSEIIQTLKNTIKIEDVLEWYTEVFLYKSKWSYRCTLHGEDLHPSGVIYPDEYRCYCFVCNRGGDIFDVVQLFEHLELPAAIAKLARHIGLDTKPLIKPKSPYKDISA